jgi:uncharacterized membrane protein
LIKNLPVEEPIMLSPSKNDSKILAAISYLFGTIVSLIIYLLAKEDKWLRFHALQALVFDIAFVAVYMVIVVLAFATTFATMGVGLICVLPLFLVIPAYMLAKLWWAYRSFKGEHFETPYISDIVKKNL